MKEIKKEKIYNFFDEKGKMSSTNIVVLLFFSVAIILYFNYYNLSVYKLNGEFLYSHPSKFDIWYYIFVQQKDDFIYGINMYISFIPLFCTFIIMYFVNKAVKPYINMATLGLESYKLIYKKYGYLLKLKKNEVEDFEYVVKQEGAFKQIFGINKKLYIERISGTPNIKIEIEKEL